MVNMQAKKKTLQTESRFGAQPSTPTRLKLSSSSSTYKSLAKQPNFKVRRQVQGFTGPDYLTLEPLFDLTSYWAKILSLRYLCQL
jgi:hypothetical protein